MYATDVMTTNVISVTPGTSVRELAEILGRHGISGAPVVDGANTLVGSVSEGDLLHRAETGTDRRTNRRRPRWLDVFAGGRDDAQDYVRSHGRAVRDVMTRDVVTVTEMTDLTELANLLETKRIKRVPVLRDGRVVGIVSRSNLVRALAAANFGAAADALAGDRSIRHALLTELSGRDWACVWAADILVRDGVVHLWCADDRPEAQRQALRVAAENTPGVQSVAMHLVPMAVNPAI